MSGFDQRNLLPRRNVRRRHVGPVFSSVGGEMNQTVIGPAPDPVHLEGGGRNGVNHTASMSLLCCVLFVFSNARRHLVIRSRQIRADLFPMIATIPCLPKRGSREKEPL